MSSNAPQLNSNQLEIGLDGVLTVIGDHDGVAVIQIEGFAFANNGKAKEKIEERFRYEGRPFVTQCLLTMAVGTKNPVFIFTTNTGLKIDDLQWFLRMVRNKLMSIAAEVKLLS